MKMAKEDKRTRGVREKKIQIEQKGRDDAAAMPIEPTVSKACPKNYRRRFVRSTFLSFSHSLLKMEWVTRPIALTTR